MDKTCTSDALITNTMCGMTNNIYLLLLLLLCTYFNNHVSKFF